MTSATEKNRIKVFAIRREHWFDEWMRYTWRMLVSGICPCCGRKVDGDDDE